jgi:hypothetical protein
MCDKADPPHLSRRLCVSTQRPRRRCIGEKNDEFPPLQGIDPDAIRLKFSVEILLDLRETSKITVAALFCAKADLGQIAVTIEYASHFSMPGASRRRWGFAAAQILSARYSVLHEDPSRQTVT